MSNNISIEQWVANFDAGMYAATDFQTQVDAGWYDWFCRDTSLANKTKRMAPMIKKIAGSKRIDPKRLYVWFKNNCPLYGPLYDDFRFADIETGNVRYTIIPKSGHTGEAEVWGQDNGFTEALVSGTMRDVYKYFGV